MSCSVDDCGKSVLARGWCGMHYRRWQRNGTTEKVKGTRTCDICAAPHYGRGWCQVHYLRWYTHGDAAYRSPGEVVDGQRICANCSVDKPIDAFGIDRSLPSGRAIYCRECNRAASLRQYASDPVKACAIKRRWATAHPDALRDRDARRRALKRGVEAERVYRKKVFERDDWICQLCMDPVDPTLPSRDPYSVSLDHRIPLAKGGSHTEANCQTAHLVCNVRKGARVEAVAS